MKRAKINGTEIAYQIQGESSAEPVVLLHPGVVADAFVPLLREPELRERYQLVNYHRRGYGESARTTTPLTIPQQAEDVRALLDHLNISRAHLVAHSYGGAIALQLAIAAPDLVHSLALLEPAGIAGVPSDPQMQQIFFGTLAAAGAQYAAGDKVGAVDAFSKGAFGPDYRVTLDQALPHAFADFANVADALFQSEFGSLQTWAFTPELASQIRRPVLSVLHVAPVPIFQETHEKLLAWLPQTETLVIPNTTHLLEIASPRSVAIGLAEFFARHPIRMHA
jgi:pimeloyl-ACP methyl ester carboxylesterase